MANISAPGCKGILFIGDPHIWSRKPGRRLDEDFCLTVIGKLGQCSQICRDKGLYPVFLGDLFDDADDEDALMMNRTVKALRAFPAVPVTIVGNHERKHAKLTDDTALAVLRDAGLLWVGEEAMDSFCIELASNRKVLLVSFPHGTPIAKSVAPLRAACGAQACFALTHHDIAFKGAYPGAAEPTEIEGAEFAVNGHMHKPAPDIAAGATVWKCPGNITRMSVDLRNQVPSVLAWTADGGFEQIALKVDPNAFNLAGLLAGPAAAPDGSAQAARILAADSDFAALLKAKKDQDAKRTDDAAFLREDMQALFQIKSTDPAVQADLISLLEQALRS